MTGAALPSTPSSRSKARQRPGEHQNAPSSRLGVQAGPRIGTLLLLSVAGLSGLAAWGGQQLINRKHQRLTPELTQAQLWGHYRWAIDPQIRREAALLMVARDGAPELLHGQGWGHDPVAAVVLERAALTADAQGNSAEAARTWQLLLDRFPEAPGSAWARLALGQNTPLLHQQLLQQQPGPPSSADLGGRGWGRTAAQPSRGPAPGPLGCTPARGPGADA